MFNGLLNKFSNTIDSIKSSLLKNESNDEEDNSFKTENKITIIIGSTNFYFNFNDNIETIPVLLLLRGDNILYGNKVIEKISDHKYIDNAMIFFDFLYYLDKKYEELKDILIERNLMNNDFSFLKDNKDKTISFNYMFLSSNKEEKQKVINQEEEKKDNNQEEEKKVINQEEEKKDNNKEEKEKVINHRVPVGKNGNIALPSVEQPKKGYSEQNNKNSNFNYYTSEELLNIFIENLIKDKLNNLKDEYFSLKLILPPYLNNQQKEKIKSIFLNKLGEEKTKNLLNFIIKDEMDYYLDNLKFSCYFM